MIGTLHTKDFSCLIAGDHVPRKGELLSCDGYAAGLGQSEKDGIFEVTHVMYQYPNNPGSQRVDIYARRLGEGIPEIGFDKFSEFIYQARLKQISERSKG